MVIFLYSLYSSVWIQLKSVLNHNPKQFYNELCFKEYTCYLSFVDLNYRVLKANEDNIFFLVGIQRMDAAYPNHVDVKNPHSFEPKDLEKLIQKVISVAWRKDCGITWGL